MKYSPQRGFSLIEVTVGVGIVALMILSTSLMLQRLPVSGRETRDTDLALKIAREEIELLRAGGYDALPVSGSFTHSLLTSLTSGAGALLLSDYNASAKEVVVTVSWSGAASPRSVSLTTLIVEHSEFP